MPKAKLSNAELVVFTRKISNGDWMVEELKGTSEQPNSTYRIVAPPADIIADKEKVLGVGIKKAVRLEMQGA